MNTIDHECYVSLEIAKLLKEAGFDWEVQSYYSKLSRMQGKLLWLTCGCKYKENININQNRYSAPTLEVAQRWLRVVKQIHLYVRPILDEHKYVVTVVVDDLTWGQVNDNNGTSKRFNTYEEAQEAGIKKALEIILEKEE